MEFSLWAAISAILGFTYFTAWSISFYPQPLINYTRKSVEGTCIDLPIANIIGLASYAAYTGAMLFSPVIRQQYADRSPGSPEPAVSVWDFAFASHGCVCVLVVLVQFWWYNNKDRREDRRGRRPAAWIMATCAGGVCVILVLTVITAFRQSGARVRGGWEWLDVIYAISGLKLVLTVVKFTPQVILNYRRRSTVGWSIYAILLDFVGGIASILQLIIDAFIISKDWQAGISGNLVKLILGLPIFDCIFMYQHYIAYPQREKVDAGGEEEGQEQADGERRPLLRA